MHEMHELISSANHLEYAVMSSLRAKYRQYLVPLMLRPTGVVKYSSPVVSLVYQVDRCEFSYHARHSIQKVV